MNWTDKELRQREESWCSRRRGGRDKGLSQDWNAPSQRGAWLGRRLLWVERPERALNAELRYLDSIPRQWGARAGV